MVAYQETLLNKEGYVVRKLVQSAFSFQHLPPDTPVTHEGWSTSHHIYHRWEVQHQSKGKNGYHMCALFSVDPRGHHIVMTVTDAQSPSVA